jgi:heat shock protein HslJ
MSRAFVTSIVLVILLLSIWLAGAITAVDASSSHGQHPLANTSWSLVEFKSMDDTIGTVRPNDPSLYSLHLNNDGTVEMQLNCNSARGQWSVDTGGGGESGRFEFGSLVATHAICSPPSMDKKIAADAQYIRGYLLKNGKLYLSLMADAGIYAWERKGIEPRLVATPASPEEVGPRNWTVSKVISGLNLREQPVLKANVLTTYPPGTILDNLGCQRGEDRIWCDVQQSGGGPRGYVAAEFLDHAISQDGSVSNGPDDSALRAGQGEFDATGVIPCAQHLGQPMMQCGFGVARSGGGYATVVIKKPDGYTRAIFFRMGKPKGADTSQADGYPEFSATKESDLNMIRIGNERYEIPDAVISGG